MEKIKSEINKLWIYSIFSSILFIVIGVFLFLNPSFVIHFISFVLGIFMIVAGIYAFVQYFSSSSHNLYNMYLLYGVIGFLAGALLIFNPTAVASILPLALGIWMIVHSIVKLKYSLSLRTLSSVHFSSTIIMALLTLSVGILFVLNPFQGATFLMKLLGAMIALYAFIDLVNAFCLKRNMKSIQK